MEFSETVQALRTHRDSCRFAFFHGIQIPLFFLGILVLQNLELFLLKTKEQMCLFFRSFELTVFASFMPLSNYLNCTFNAFKIKKYRRGEVCELTHVFFHISRQMNYKKYILTSKLRFVRKSQIQTGSLLFRKKMDAIFIFIFLKYM